MTVTTIDQHIVQTPGVVGGKPRIAGRRISVNDIVVWHERMGRSVDEISADFDLSFAEIYAALAYCFDHRDEIDNSIKIAEEFAEQMRRTNNSPLAEKLKAMRGD